MKFGVSTYSFQPMIDSNKITQFDTIAMAKNLGFDAVEFAELFPAEGESKIDYARRVRKECDDKGIEIASYAVGTDFLNCKDHDWEKEVERLKSEVDLALILKVKKMRHDVSTGFATNPGEYMSFDIALPMFANACREVTSYASTLGIRTMVENHGFYCQESLDVKKLVDMVNHPNFGTLVDIGNFLCADEDSAKAVGRMIPYAFHVHVKDFHVKNGSGSNPGRGWFMSRGGSYLRGAIIGNGDVPILACLRLINRAGYDDYISIEFEGMEDSIVGIETGLENLKKLVDSI